MSAPTPYYQDESSTIYLGDSREVLPSLDVGSIDVVFTSPPYNRGDMAGGLAKLAGGYASYADQMPEEDYVAWQRETLSVCWGLLSERGAIFYNHKPRIRQEGLWLPLCLNPGLPLRQIIVWDYVAGCNWSPKHFMPLHEWVMLFSKPGFELRSRSASTAGDVWRFRVEVPGTGRPKHPAAFPLKLPTRALAALPTSVVLDPFMGSGTTLLAAKNLGHRAIGVEINEEYAEIAANRLCQEVLDLGGTA